MRKLYLIILTISFLISCIAQTKGPRYYTELGRSLCTEGNYMQGMQYYRKAIEMDSNYVDAYVDRALWRLNYKDYDGSINDWKKVLSLKPKNILALNNLGVVYESMGELDSALIYFTKSIELDSLGIGSYFNRASIYFMQGKLEMAANDYQKDIEIGTLTDAVSYYMCGIIKIELGDSLNGKMYLEKAFEIDSLIESKMQKHVSHLRSLREN